MDEKLESANKILKITALWIAIIPAVLLSIFSYSLGFIVRSCRDYFLMGLEEDANGKS